MTTDIKVTTVVMEPTLRIQDYLADDIELTEAEELSANAFNSAFRQGGLIVYTGTMPEFIHFSRVEALTTTDDAVVVHLSSKPTVFRFVSNRLVVAAAMTLEVALERFYRYPERRVAHQESKPLKPSGTTDSDYASTEA